MAAYLVKRLFGIIPTLLLLILAVVVLSRLGGISAVDGMLGDRAADPKARAQVEARLGLDDSPPVAYARYIRGLVTGNLGTSILSKRPVRAMLLERLNVTLELAIFSLVIGCSVGTVLGVASAILHDGAADYVLRGIAIVGLTVPTFAIGTAAVVFPAIWWRWSPPLFYTSFGHDPIGHLSQFVIPSLIVAFTLMGPAMRLMRTQMLEVLRQDYVRTAREKGLTEWTIIGRHALRNTAVPCISLFGLQVASAMSGTVIVETIFSLPGLGRLLLTSVSGGDWPVVQGVTVVVGLWVMIITLLVDLSYPIFDPRVKQS